jgi:protein-S-isoprenylcysteine O-methyltransferase Ste14
MLFAFAIQWGLLFSMPRGVFTRLFDRREWGKKRMALFRTGKLLALVCILIVSFFPIQTGTLFFIPGVVLYVLGLAGLVISLLDYRNTPNDQPAMKGLYRFSRHPQVMATAVVFLGICLMVASPLAIACLLLARVLEHNGILEEERLCLQYYGETYRDYMQRVPRYFWFF